jgi:Tat protein secretion system quality control protein TatD with DNase activity
MTEPGMVMDSVREIAALRGFDETVVRRVLASNTRQFYGWPELG